MTEKVFMSDETHATLDQAIAAVRAGHRDDAIRMLRQIVADDPFNADAWVWLGGIASDPREQRSALEQALTVAPQNQRAQQGLNWLRQNHPAIFDTPVDTRPSVQRTTPSYTQTAAYEHQSEPAEPSRASIYEAPAQARVAPYEAPTQAMPTYQAQAEVSNQALPRYQTQADARTQAMPTYQAQADAADTGYTHQTDRMTAFTPLRSTTVDAGRTDRMATVSPPTPAGAVVYRRSPGAEFARWLVLLTWIFSFGMVTTFAALIWAFPNNFQSATQPLLSIFGFRWIPADVEPTRLGTAIGLSVLAVVALMIILGLLFRGRWAWSINALIATIGMFGAAGLVALAATGQTPFSAGGFSLTTLPEQILGGLLAFTVIFFLLSLGSRRAFFRRQVGQPR